MIRISSSFSLPSFTKCPRIQPINVLHYDSTRNSSSQTNTNNNTARKRLGIGGWKLSSTEQCNQYASVIHTSLQNGVNTFEANTSDEGEKSLANAYKSAMTMDPKIASTESTNMAVKFGYRTTTKNNKMEGDVCIANQRDVRGNTHNISKEYIEHTLSSSPLVTLQQQQNNMNLIYMAHNPQLQALSISEEAPQDDKRGLVKERLTESFMALEEACGNNTISSYGICSIGLSLSKENHFYLDWRDVLDAACDAATAVNGKPTMPNLSTLELPANLLEPNGIMVSKQIQTFLKSIQPQNNVDEKNLNSSIFPASIDMFISRPLTCYPTTSNSKHSIKLVDYLIDASDDGTKPKQWTHQIPSNRPPIYPPAYQSALDHFDCNPLLECQTRRKLSVEERETLEGCELLASLLHDLDRELESTKLVSFAAHQIHIYTKVLPMIQDTFEELDKATAAVLQQFFAAYESAVRHVICRNIRTQLIQGEFEGNGVIPKYDIPEEDTLQQFGLQWLLRHEDGIV